MTATPRFEAWEQQALQVDAKVALMATLDAAGWPHLTLITSLQPNAERELTWGQFCEGRSKDHVRARPTVGFLMMLPDRRLWRGSARWTHARQGGAEFDAYNQKPLFRYNAYFGIHTVHFMDLLELEGPQALALPRALGGKALALARGPWLPSRAADLSSRPLGAWVRNLLRHPASLTFVAWVDEQGRPQVAAAVAAAPGRPGELLIASATLPTGLQSGTGPGWVAVLTLNLKMQSVCVRGRLSPRSGGGPLATSRLLIEEVYNPMPPLPGRVWPPEPLVPVVDFGSSAGGGAAPVARQEPS